MTDKTPKNYLSIGDLDLLLLPDTPRDYADCRAILDFSLPHYNVVSTDAAPWQDDALWTMMEAPAWRQLLILSQNVGPFETGLTLMALQKGFDVFLACPEPEAASQNRIARLRQSSAIVLSLDDALEELNLQRGET